MDTGFWELVAYEDEVVIEAYDSALGVCGGVGEVDA